MKYEFLTHLWQVAKRHLPTILTVATSIGVVAVGVTSAMVSEKAHADYTESTQAGESKQKAILKASKRYIPTFFIAGLTIACAFESNILNHKEQAAIMTGYVGLQEYIKRYRQNTEAIVGPDVEHEIASETQEQVAHEMVKQYAHHTINPDCPDRKARKAHWYEPISKQYFWRYEREIIDAEYHFNRNFVMAGYLPSNSLQYFLGIPDRGEDGKKEGWSATDLEVPWIDFEHRLETTPDGIECYVIHAEYTPD